MADPAIRDINYYRKFFDSGNEQYGGDFNATYNAIQKWIDDVIRPQKLEDTKKEMEAQSRSLYGAGIDIAAAAAGMGVLVDTERELLEETIEPADVSQLMIEMLDDFVSSYENTYGVTPGFEPNGTVDRAADHIVKFFLASEKGFDVTDPVYISITGGGDRGSWAGREDNRIWGILDSIYDNRSQHIAQQPFHFSEWSKKEAVFDAMEEFGVIDSSDRKDKAFLDAFEDQWNDIFIDLRSQSTARTPSYRSMAASLIAKATGRRGTSEDAIDFGYITTLNTDSPRTKKEYTDIQAGREVLEGLTEEDLSAIPTDPRSWAKKYYGNTLSEYYKSGFHKLPEDTGKSARSIAHDQWINTAGDLIGREYEKLRTALNPNGTLRYTEKEVVSLIEAFARNHFNDPLRPDLDAITAGEEQETAQTEAQKEFDDAYKDAVSGGQFVTLAKNAVEEILGIGVTLPKHGINALAEILREAYGDNKTLGLLPPDDVNTLKPYTNFMNEWLQYGSTDVERKDFFDKSAKAMLGIDDLTPAEDVTGLTGAIDDISDFIDKWTKQNPWDTTSPFQLATGFGQEYGLTPSGALKRWDSVDRSLYSYERDWIQDPRFTLEPTGDMPVIPGIDFTGRLSPDDIDALRDLYTAETQYAPQPYEEGDWISPSMLPQPSPYYGTAFSDLFTTEQAFGPKSAADIFLEEWDAQRKGMTPADRADFWTRQRGGSSPPPIPELALEWAQGYGAPKYDDEGNLISGAPAYDFRAYERDLIEQWELGNLTKTDPNSGDVIPWDQADIDATLAARLRSQAGDPSYPHLTETDYPTRENVFSSLRDVFSGSEAQKSYIENVISEGDIDFTPFETRVGQIRQREGLRHPQTIPTDPMGAVPNFTSQLLPNLQKDFVQKQQEEQLAERTRRGELAGMGSTIFKRRTL